MAYIESVPFLGLTTNISSRKYGFVALYKMGQWSERLSHFLASCRKKMLQNVTLFWLFEKCNLLAKTRKIVVSNSGLVAVYKTLQSKATVTFCICQ